ncbi:MAG: hypothetical protein IIA66_13790 [Planctomycetes bacterium]|nr:hypothetical protein [Planctomycetota bacterium]
MKTEFRPLLVDAQGRPSLGYLEHRGEMYDLRDWSLATDDDDEKSRTFAHFAVGPTIADDGSGFYGMMLISFPVEGDGASHVVMFEEPGEDQCVEIADIDRPILADLQLVLPE